MDGVEEYQFKDYKKGLTYQRELFKRAKQELNFNIMCNSISNLKSDLKSKALKQNMNKEIKYIEKVIDWVIKAEKKYSNPTPYGDIVLNLPNNWKYRVNELLTKSYEKLMAIQEDLGLL